MIRAFLFGLWVATFSSCTEDPCYLKTVPLEGTYALDEVYDVDGSGMDAVDGEIEITTDEVKVTYARADGSRYRVVLRVTDKELR